MASSDSVERDAAVRASAPQGGGKQRFAHEQDSAAQLFSSIVGDAQSVLKCAGRTARLLEEQFIIDGWPIGRIYGSEIELAQRYGVGRAIARETARILEARGTARMRRGRHGGLELTTPSVERLYDMISGYCYLIGVTREQVRTARIVLDRVAAYMAAERGAHFEFVPLLARGAVAAPSLGRDLRRLLTVATGNAVVTFFSDCLEQLAAIELPDDHAKERRPVTGHLEKCIDRLVMAISRGDAHAAAAWAAACSRRIAEQPAEPQRDLAATTPVGEHRPGVYAREGLHRTRAGQIVHNLMKRVGPGQWQDGHILGNELELCERYRVDRGVLRQAIRILEAAETAVSVPGRGHGLVARSPGPGSISRLICCHFAANRVGHYQSFQVFKWLGVELMGLAARNAPAASLGPIEAELVALTKKTDTVLLSDLVAIEEKQFALAGNPVLNMFWRSAKAFPSWAIQGNFPVAPQTLADFLQCSTQATAAIAEHNAVVAARAQERKFQLLRHNLDQYFKNFRSGSMALPDMAEREPPTGFSEES